MFMCVCVQDRDIYGWWENIKRTGIARHNVALMQQHQQQYKWNISILFHTVQYNTNTQPVFK